MGEFEGGYMARRHDSLAVSGMEQLVGSDLNAGGTS
jgi:hypothetical protein